MNDVCVLTRGAVALSSFHIFFYFLPSDWNETFDDIDSQRSGNDLCLLTVCRCRVLQVCFAALNRLSKCTYKIFSVLCCAIDKCRQHERSFFFSPFHSSSSLAGTSSHDNWKYININLQLLALFEWWRGGDGNDDVYEFFGARFTVNCNKFVFFVCRNEAHGMSNRISRYTFSRLPPPNIHRNGNARCSLLVVVLTYRWIHHYCTI